MYNEGISLVGDLLDTATLSKIIEKTGNTYNFHDTKLGVGRENSKQFLKEHPDIAFQIREELFRQSARGAGEEPSTFAGGVEEEALQAAAPGV